MSLADTCLRPPRVWHSNVVARPRMHCKLQCRFVPTEDFVAQPKALQVPFMARLTSANRPKLSLPRLLPSAPWIFSLQC